jgi:hypothetical protein
MAVSLHVIHCCNTKPPFWNHDFFFFVKKIKKMFSRPLRVGHNLRSPANSASNVDRGDLDPQARPGQQQRAEPGGHHRWKNGK